MNSAAIHEGFDHIGYYSEDLGSAFERFTALGFTVAPPSRFVEQPFTTCAIFIDDAYISISGVEDWATAPEWMKEGMGTGLQAFVLRGKHLDEVYARLGSCGNGVLQPDGLVQMISRVLRVEGIDRRARFRVLRLKRRSLPGLSRINFCEHLTPELLWQPHLRRHRNGVVAIRSVTAVHESPADAAEPYRKLFNQVDLSPEGDLLVNCRLTTLRLVTPQRLRAIWPGDLAPAYVPDEALVAGTTLTTNASPPDIRALLVQSGIAAFDTPSGGIAVASADAYGGVIEFVPV